jgi:hypothetical protein
MDKIPMTAEGYAQLEKELKQRQSEERPRIIQQITDARTHGDLSENAEYHAAKEEQAHNEGRIAELEDKLARAESASPRPTPRRSASPSRPPSPAPSWARRRAIRSRWSPPAAPRPSRW